jgi:hypothetical protein
MSGDRLTDKKRFGDGGRSLWIRRRLLPDLLDELAGLFQFSVTGDADLEPVGDPVAAHVFQRPKLAGGQRVDRPTVMPQNDRAQTEGLDRSLAGAALDVLTDPKGIVEQIEDAIDDNRRRRLRAEPDGNPQ